MLASTEEFDAIFFQQNTNRLHQAQIKGHEIAHLICGHQAVSVDGTGLLCSYPILIPHWCGR